MDKQDPRRMELGALLSPLNLPPEVSDVTVTDLTLDSREVSEGGAFVAVAGRQQHGRNFIESAIEKGAAAILLEDDSRDTWWAEDAEHRVAIVAVKDLSRKISEIAGRFYGVPSRSLSLIGVTGTNGKSTTVSLIAQLYEMLGTSSATMGTLGVIIGGKTIADTRMTTPDAVNCQKWLARLQMDGVRAVAMEVSSHGLDQSRVAGLSFRTAVFTNLSHDHLDYHRSSQRYARAKQMLFESADLGSAVVNLDDAHAAQMMAATRPPTQVIGYSLRQHEAEVYASELRFHKDGVTFQVRSIWGECEVTSALLGEFNVYNLLAAIAAVCADGADFPDVVRCIQNLRAVPGRMEVVAVPRADVTVVIDYAHTPDALQQAIKAARKHTRGDLWVVFGCGGDRDSLKRPLMGKAAQEFADFVCVTSDNPRNEDPLRIIDAICAGMSGRAYDVVPDRKTAIEQAIGKARGGDVVLIAGKGHEKYQVIGDHKIPFDDYAIAQRVLRERLAKAGGA